jgi:hypothetical protein
MELETVRCSPSFRGGEKEVSGKIDDVHNIRIHYVNVLDQENHHVFGAEVVARFHPKAPEDLEFESVSVYGNSVKPSAHQIADRLFR